MNTKLLMVTSAILMGALGLSASFLPQEILQAIGIQPNLYLLLIVQMLGALWMGSAMVNWMAKDVLIGGIYARPLTVGNLMHFTVGALVLLKRLPANSHSILLWVAGVIYVSLAAGFAVVLFTHPGKKIDTNP